MFRKGETRRFEDNVGKDSMLETCPRCGWPCTHTVTAYWDSLWNQHGGFCTQCCDEAANKFDRTSWPELPEDKNSELKAVEVVAKIQTLWD